MSKKILSLLLTLIMVFTVISPVSYAVSAASYAQTLRNKGFPESYVTILTKLHSKYPKWQFEPIKTGLDWNTAVDGERANGHGQQSIEKLSSRSKAYYCSCSKCCSGGYYHIVESPDWVAASEKAVKYYMDPRNWMTPKYIFQFESIKYDSSVKQKGVESILKTSFMYNKYITYKNYNGKTVTYKNKSGNKVKYSQAFMEAGKSANLNPYFLASKVKLEIGTNDASRAGGSSGTKEPFLGIFNYYSIGASSNASMGLEWANGYMRTLRSTKLYSKYDSKNKKGAGTVTNFGAKQYLAYRGSAGSYYKVRLYYTNGYSYSGGKIGYVKKSDVRTTYLTYSRPWTTPYKTITGGAAYIRDLWGKYQYNDYLQKFNVNPESGYLHAYEYSITVNAPSKASESTYEAYKDAGVLSDKHVFYIPVFKNMPSKKCVVEASSNSKSSTTGSSKSAVNCVSGLKMTKRTQNTISFKWNKYSGATKYYMYIKNVTLGTHFAKTVTTNTATIKGLNPANKYSVHVKAYTKKGWTKYSAYNTKHTLPPKASGLKLAAKPTADSAELRWNKVSGASGYKVYAYNKAKNKYKCLGNFKANHGKVKLSPGTHYRLFVAAYIKDIEVKRGKLSNQLAFKTSGAKKKKALVAAVKLKSVTSPKRSKIKVVWSKPSGKVSGYQIWWARDKKFKNRVANTIIKSSKTTSYVGSNFTKGRSYYIKVRAYRTVSGKKVYGKWSAAKKVISK
ncbi:MAG: fibronectin type III domain-containing protein [Eubacterium sp.]|nr:fibronectin type III domain-containing protein [Eubacterium sp.]